MKELRCPWCGTDPLYVEYHDREWGVPQHDNQRLFEALVLDGAQAGLSWLTILRKRENYRQAFAGFDVEAVAKFDNKKIEALMQNSGIVRNRAKIISAVGNARATLALNQSLDDFLWGFVDGQTIEYKRRTMQDIPAQSPQSEAMSKALKKADFNFVGPTICYAFMQATGMVNDHLVSCPRWKEVGV